MQKNIVSETFHVLKCIYGFLLDDIFIIGCFTLSALGHFHVVDTLGMYLFSGLIFLIFCIALWIFRRHRKKLVIEVSKGR